MELSMVTRTIYVVPLALNEGDRSVLEKSRFE
jgi:hypothetical protein